MSVLYQKIKATAQANSQKIAIVFYGKRYKFDKVLSLIERAAFGLNACGVKKGSVVTLCMLNTPSTLIAFYALNRIGAIINLVHPFVSAEGLAASIKQTGSSLIIAYDLFLIEKGRELGLELAELNIDAKVILSRSDYFMRLSAKLCFNLFRKNKARQRAKQKAKNLQDSADKTRIKYQKFENFFKYPEIKDFPTNLSKDQPAVYLPSGGTLGLPKIIVHRESVFNELCSHAQFFLSEPLANYDAMYSVLPIFHGFGLCMNMHMCVVLGMKNVMSMKFRAADVAKAIKKEKVNIIMGVPSMFTRLLECPKFLKTDLSSIKDCFVGGDTVPKNLVESFNDILKNRGSKGRLNIGYGLTETVAVCSVNCSAFYKVGSVGHALPDASIAVIKDGKRAAVGETGEILVKTPLLMLRYLDGQNSVAGQNTDPKSKSEGLASQESPIKEFEGEQWLFTGDLGFLDEDGFLFFKQRIKNMIKVNGVPVYPCEIEEIVESLPWVARAAAIGIQDKNSGEVVKLFIEAPAQQLKKFFEKTDETTLKEIILTLCKKKLIRYAVPKVIEIREALPLNAMGKVDRKKL